MLTGLAVKVTAADPESARAYNGKRYYDQGIGRYAPEDVYQRGLADLAALANLLGTGTFPFGQRPHSADAGCYGFLANTFYCRIDTPLRGLSSRTPNSAAIAKRCTAR